MNSMKIVEKAYEEYNKREQEKEEELINKDKDAMFEELFEKIFKEKQ